MGKSANALVKFMLAWTEPFLAFLKKSKGKVQFRQASEHVHVCPCPPSPFKISSLHLLTCFLLLFTSSTIARAHGMKCLDIGIEKGSWCSAAYWESCGFFSKTVMRKYQTAIPNQFQSLDKNSGFAPSHNPDIAGSDNVANPSLDYQNHLVA